MCVIRIKTENYNFLCFKDDVIITHEMCLRILCSSKYHMSFIKFMYISQLHFLVKSTMFGNAGIGTYSHFSTNIFH